MNKDPRKVFGERVRAFRVKANLSQEALAEAAGIHRTYIGSVERGERNISILNIVALSRAIGIKPSDLLEGVE